MSKNMNFSNNHAFIEAVAHGSRSAGTADINGASVNTHNAECIVAVIEFGAISATAVTAVKWQGREDGGSWADVPNSEITIEPDDDNQYFVLDLHKPTYTNSRIVIERGTANAALRSAQYIVGGLRKAPRDSGTGYTVQLNIGGEDGDEHTNPKS